MSKKPKFHLVYRRGDSPFWWARGGSNGRYFRESTKTTDYQEARAYQRRRTAEVEAEAERETYVPRAGDFVMADLAKLIRDDYTIGKFKSRGRLESSLKHLKAHFGHVRVVDIPARVQDYILARRAEIVAARTKNVPEDRKEAAAATASDASIRLELLALKRAMRLAGLDDVAKGVKMPPPPKNARQGFVDHAGLGRLMASLPQHLRPLVGLAFHTGWRRGELTNLRWANVDLAAGELRLGARETKSGESRWFPYAENPRLVEIIEGQRARADALQRERSTIINHVFFQPDGKPLLWFRDSWITACRKAGFPGLLFHDLRRSAARNMAQQGVAEEKIMKLCGWKTRSMFDRYNITTEADLKEAVRRAAGGS